MSIDACRAGEPHYCGLEGDHHRYEIQYRKEGIYILYGYTKYHPVEDKRGRLLIYELLKKGIPKEDIRVKDSEGGKE